MHEKFLDWLECPACRDSLRLGAVSERDGKAVIEGSLVCAGCNQDYPVCGRIPRFVPDEGYAQSFGWQWNRWSQIQRDSYNGTTRTRDALLKRTGWSPDELSGSSLLECGCGAGVDTEVWADLVGTLISLDISSSVDTIPEEVIRRDHVLVIQADLYRIPVRRAAFNFVSCHRVIQHTPDPAAAFASMAPQVKPGGRFFLHCYDNHWKSRLQYKYLYRPITTRLPHTWAYWGLRAVGPVLHPLVGAVRRIGFLRKPVKLLVPFRPCARGLRRDGATLTRREIYEYGLLVTFDALTATYDYPQSPETLRSWFEQQGFEDIELRGRNPVKMVGRKSE